MKIDVLYVISITIISIYFSVASIQYGIFSSFGDTIYTYPAMFISCMFVTFAINPRGVMLDNAGETMVETIIKHHKKNIKY